MAAPNTWLLFHTQRAPRGHRPDGRCHLAPPDNVTYLALRKAG